MEIIKLTKNNHQAVVKQAVTVLQNAGLVIYPTETVYGAGVDATNQEAVNKLLQYKSRREGKPLSIAVNSLKMAGNYVELNQQAKDFYNKFLPGPYTIISKTIDDSNLAHGVASEFDTVGVRIPDYKLILNLVSLLKKPITATSANASNKKRPYTVDDILNSLSQKQKGLIDLIIDAGQLPANEPSTVIDTTLSTPLTMRGGKNTRANITKFISQSDQETQEIAGKLLLKYWKQIQRNGLVIGLDGKLGAGKTVFTKGLGKFLMIDQIINSPTYTYSKEYEYQRHQTSGKLIHVDLWRVDNNEDLNSLRLKQYLQPNSVIAIEWFEQMKNLTKNKNNMPADLIIKITALSDKKREIEVIENNDK